MASPLDRLNPNLKSTLAQLGASMNMFNRTPAAEPTTATSEPARSPEAQAMFDTKRTIINKVRADAAANGSAPSLEQYRLACVDFANSPQGQAMGTNWNPASYADLSGQDLSGFVITEPKKINGTNYDPADETHGHHLVRPNYDSHDRDGDGGITVAAASAFYDNVRFEKTDLHGAIVEPATSFNDEIAKAGDLKGIIFNGMGLDEKGDAEKFTFRAANYKDVRLTNINDGEIEFAANSHVEGVSIEGKRAKITIGDYATVDNIEVSNGFRIISLDMGKNSVLSNSNLGQSTVSMTSTFEAGATFQNVELSGNLSGLDFSGLKLNNVIIDGVAITKASDLDQFGIKHEGTIVAASAELGRAPAPAPAADPKRDMIADLGATLLNANKLIGTSTQPTAAAAEKMAEKAAPTPILFGGDAKEVVLSQAVANMERTVPVNEQASGANMQRGKAAE